MNKPLNPFSHIYVNTDVEPKYKTDEFKDEVVCYSVEHTTKEASEKYGILTETINCWRRKRGYTRAGYRKEITERRNKCIGKYFSKNPNRLVTLKELTDLVRKPQRSAFVQHINLLVEQGYLKRIKAKYGKLTIGLILLKEIVTNENKHG